MPFVEGERRIIGRERIYSDYHGDPAVPHAETFVDIEPSFGKALKLRIGHLPNEGEQECYLDIKELVINDRKIEWQEEDTAVIKTGTNTKPVELPTATADEVRMVASADPD